MKGSDLLLLISLLFVPHVLLLFYFYGGDYGHSPAATMRDTGLSVMETMRARSLRIAEYCSKYPHLRTGWRSNPDVLVSRLHNLSWCKIPKSASTSVVHALLMVLGNEAILQSANRGGQHTSLRRLMPFLRPAEAMPSPGNAFMLLRHPFSRILSAYRDKIASSKGSAKFAKFFKMYNSPIIAKYRQRQPENSFYENVPTFPEFVQYLLNTSSRKYNEHWKPYYLLCTPCDVPYNLVLKIESLKNDNLALTLSTGLPQLWINNTHRTNPEVFLKSTTLANASLNNLLPDNQDEFKENIGNSTVIEQYYFSQLTQTQILQLFAAYKEDFEMFGYDIEPYLSYGIS